MQPTAPRYHAPIGIDERIDEAIDNCNQRIAAIFGLFKPSKLVIESAAAGALTVIPIALTNHNHDTRTDSLFFLTSAVSYYVLNRLLHNR